MPAATAADTPIQQLWTALHSAGYLDNANSRLALPASNSLGSPTLSALLGDSTLFPNARLDMALSAAQPSGSQIVLAGTLGDPFLGAPGAAAVATLSIGGDGKPALALAVAMPDGPVLANAFSGLDKDSAPGAQVFTGASFTASSGQPTLTFSGIPTLDPAYAGLWRSGPGALAGTVTDWSPGNPAFSLATSQTEAAATAGALPLQVQLLLTCDSNGGAGTIQGLLVNSGISSDPIQLALSLPPPENMFPTLANNALAISPVGLGQLAPLAMGQQLAALIPSRFSLGDGLTLSGLQLGLAIGGASTNSVQVTIGSSASFALLPANLANLSQISASYLVFGLSGSSIIFNGVFELAGKKELSFYAGFSLPDCQVSASNVKPIDVGVLLSAVLGIQPPKTGMTIETLAATLSPIDGTYSFTGDVQFQNWSIPLVSGVSAVEIDDLGLTLVRTSSSLSVNLAADAKFIGFPMQLTASHDSSTPGWIFTGALTQQVDLGLLVQKLLPFSLPVAPPAIKLDTLYCSFNSSDGSYSIAASAEWDIDLLPAKIDASFALQKSSAGTYSGSITGQVDISNMVLDVGYVFSPTTTDISFAYRELTIVYHKDAPGGPTVAISLGDGSVGSLFEFLLSFAEPGRTLSLPAPWDALEKIPLPGITVTVNLNTKAISVEVDLDVDLGFLSLKNFTLDYTRQYGAAKFNLELTGSFLGQDYGGGSGNPPLSWDPLNDSAPAVPGAGSQLLDLEYLGLGQHVTLGGPLPQDMDAVVTALENALKPAPDPTKNPISQGSGEPGGLVYDAGSNWLIGTRFTLMSTVTMDIVFNDPNLYGLLIQLSGGKAGALAGLRFEILYRKVTDTIGVYHIELTLPDAMRHIEMGEVSITLPIFILDIYTNGNFKVDVGFPPRLTDFSQSFSVQVFPFTGFGGFYFAVLDGQTSTNVPKVVGGHFAPVLEFGLALQVGVGKTLSLGILSGGISITIGGMVQGVLGWYSPDDHNLPSARYHHLTGTIALVGEVYATVDFGIVQASVSLTIYASISVDVESYKSILIQASVGVSVSVSIKILFVRIHFSFSTTITESFTIGSDSTPPWTLAPPDGGGDQLPGRRSFRGQRMLAARQPPFAALRGRPPRLMQVRGSLLRYTALGAPPPVAVDVWVVPLVSQALPADFAFPGGPPFAGSVAAPVLALLLGLETSTDPNAGANQLMAFLLDWAVDSIGHAHDSVSAAVLDEILQALSDANVGPTLFSYAALQTLFEQNNVVFTPVPRPATQQAEIPMAIMAMIPELSAKSPDFSIDFTTDRLISPSYEGTVRTYFADLAARFAAANPAVQGAAPGAPESFATFLFRYHFYMLAKGAIQAARDELAATSLDLSVAGSPTSLAGVANLFNNHYTARGGDTLATIAPLFGLTETALQAANPVYSTAPPAAGQPVFIPARQIAYQSRAGDTLDLLAAGFGLDAAAIQTANPGVNFNPLAAGTAVAIPSMRILHTVLAGETAASIAGDFQVAPATLAAANPGVILNPLAVGTVLLIPLSLSPAAIAVANQAAGDILAAGTALTLTGIRLNAAATNSPSTLATQFGLTIEHILDQNRDSPTFLNPGQPIALGDLSTTTRPGDSFNGLIAYWYGGASAVDPDALSAANPSLTIAANQALQIPAASGPSIPYTTRQGDTFASIVAANSGLTVAALLAGNPPIALDPGQTAALPKVVHTTSAARILDYTVTQGDTYESIAAVLFPAGEASQRAAVLAIRQQNGAVGPPPPPDPPQPKAGQVVKIPYASSIGNIGRQYGEAVEASLASNPVMAQASILAPRAPVSIPTVTHQIVAGDTLGGIAQAYDLSLEQLADQIALVPNLFVAAPIKIAAIPGMRLSLLGNRLASAGGFTNALNMASRFMLGGLRVPAPQFQGQGPPDPNAAFPLYALAGQEFPVNPAPPADYAVTLTGNSVPWLSMAGGSLAVTLAPDELQRIADFAKLGFQSGIGAGQAQPVAAYTYVPDRQAPASLLWWQASDFPVPAPPQQPVVQPSIWTMPAPLADAVASSPGGMLAYRGAVGTTASDGTVTSTPLQASRYATIVDLTIEQVPDGAPGTYLMLGADQAGVQRLLALWAWLNSPAAAGKDTGLYIAYSSQDATAGAGTLVSDPIDRASSFLLKTNLSTESHGPARFRAAAAALTAPLNANTIASPAATLETADSLNFLQLLWECSTVRSGGYYLRYMAGGGKAGLPGTLFKAGKDATIRLVVVSDAQPANLALAQSFNNALLVGDNEDSGAHSLFFEAVVHTVAAGETLDSIAANYSWVPSLTGAVLGSVNQLIAGTMVPGTTVGGQSALADDSFASLAARAGMTVAQLVAALEGDGAALRPGALLQLTGEPVETVAEGATLQSISDEHDFLDPASLATLNAATPGLLAPNGSMTIPGQAPHLIGSADTFGSIAANAGVSLSALGEANAESAILQAGASIIVAADTLRMSASLPPGHVGFALERSYPGPTGGGDETDQQALDTLFHLLGFQLTETAAFKESNEGLPATPTGETSDDATAPWRYRQILSVYPYAKTAPASMPAAWPPSGSDPYAGIAAGATAGLALAFRDVLGNLTAGSVLPPVQGNAALVSSVGYTDPLVALSAWPSVITSYRIVNEAANLQVAVSVAPDPYLPDASAAPMIAGAPSPEAPTAASRRAAQARDRYQAIFYQLVQPDVGCALTTTLGPLADPGAMSALAMASLIGVAGSSYVFMGNAAGLVPTMRGANSTPGYATIAALTAQGTGYPVGLEDLGRVNANAAAGLLFGEGAAITVPVYQIARPGDTAQAIIGRAGIDAATLADGNESLPLAAGVMLATASRAIPSAQVGLSLAAIAAAQQCAIVDGPNQVAGLATANRTALLQPNLQLVLGNNSFTTGSTDTLESAAAALAALAGGLVTPADVAAANLYLAPLFAATASLTVASAVTLNGDTLAGVARTFGAPAGGQGSAAAQLLEANELAPGLWPASTALYVGTASWTIAEDDTLASIAAASSASPGAILSANAGRTLASSALLAIPFSADNAGIAASAYQAAAGDSFAAIAGKFDNWDAGTLAADNANVPGLFAPTPITVKGTTVRPDPSSTFASLALACDASVADVAAAVANLADLVQAGAVLAAPAMSARAGDTFGAVARRYDLDPGALAAASATLPGLLVPGASIEVAGVAATIYANDTFAMIAARLNEAQPAGSPPVAAADVGAAATGVAVEARTLIAPPAAAAIAATVTAADTQPILTLAVDLAISRDPALAAPGFTNAATVISANSAIPASPFAATEGAPQSLTRFAADFESAFPGHKLATGPKQVQSAAIIAKPSLKAAAGGGTGGKGPTQGLWVVNFSGNGDSITWQVEAGTPRFFGMAPLTTTAWSSPATGILVPTYDSVNGIGADTTHNFRGVDPEEWNRAFLDAVDLVLSPNYAAAAQSNSATAASLADIVAAKAAIAAGQAQQVTPILGADTTGLSDAVTAMTQQLLVTLGSAYTVESLVQFDVDVEGQGAGPDPATAPRLSGKLVPSTVASPADPPDGPPPDPGRPFAALAQAAGVSASYLVLVLADTPNILRADVSAHHGGNSYTTLSSDTLRSLAAALKTDIADLADGLTLDAGALFRGSTPVNVTAVTAPPLPTLSAVADWLPGTAREIVAANADLTGFFAPGSEVALGTANYDPKGSDTLSDVAGQLSLTLDALADQLAEVDAGALEGSYTLNPGAPPVALKPVPQMSFQSAKAPLSGGSTLTSLFTVNDPAAQKSVILDLDYRVSQLEFDVHAIEGVGGYQGSSWLSFVIPVADGPQTNGRIGQIQIPVPLDGYPAPAIISGQQADRPDPGGDEQATLAQWNYGFSATRQFAAQDELTLEIVFNNSTGTMGGGGSGSGNEPDRTAVIVALAGFSAIWPAVAKDLAAVPLLLDSPTQDEIKAAVNSLAALAVLAGNVQQAWTTAPRTMLAVPMPEVKYLYRVSTLAGAGAEPGAIVLDRVGQAIDFTQKPDDFLFLADSGAASGLNGGEVPEALKQSFGRFGFGLSGKELVKTGPSGNQGSDWMIVDPGDAAATPAVVPQTFRLHLPQGATGNAIQVWRQLLWPALQLGSGPNRLAAVQSGTRLLYEVAAGTIDDTANLELDFTFYRLNVLTLQSAWGGAFVSRNADLIAGADINDAFVYRTPLATFPTRITPLIVRTDALALPEGSLVQSLSAFFEALLAPQAALQPDTARDMRVQAAYWQAADGTAPVGAGGQVNPLNQRNPLVLVPLYGFDVSNDWKTDPGTFCSALAAQLQANAAAMGIDPAAPASWVFDLMIFDYGSETARQALLQIENQYLTVS